MERTKARQKIGKAAKDIFAPTTETKTAAISEQLGPGRPPVHEEPWTKVTVVLMNRQIVFLDRLANDIRASSGAAIRRAEIIRALVDALAESEIDLTTATTEEDIKIRLVNSLNKDPRH